jgi:hypothetical protein
MPADWWLTSLISIIRRNQYKTRQHCPHSCQILTTLICLGRSREVPLLPPFLPQICHKFYGASATLSVPMAECGAPASITIDHGKNRGLNGRIAAASGMNLKNSVLDKKITPACAREYKGVIGTAD